ncbi:30S ribosomal protein S12, partial [Paenibacillaceae sp. P-15]
MPTINQLVRKGREAKVVKSKSPALQKGFNALKREETDLSA